MKNSPRRFGNFILNVHIKSKLLWVYFFLILLPMAFFTLFTFTRVSNTLQQQTLTTAQKTFDDIFSVTERTMQQLDSVLEILAQDRLVYRMSSPDRKDYPVLEQYADTQQLAEMFSHLKKISSVDAIRLYVNSELLYSGENRNIFSTDSVVDSDWYRKLMASGEPIMWFSPNDFADQPAGEREYFSTVRIIYNPDAIMHPLAVLRVDIRTQNLQSAFQATPVTEHGMAVMLKDGRPVMYSSPQVETSPEKLERSDFSGFSVLQEEQWDTMMLDGMECFVRSKKMVPSGWQIATAVSIDDIYSVSRSLCAEMIIAMLAVGIVAYLIACFISRSSIRRITQLAKSMRAVQDGHVEVRLEPHGGDEIGVLMHGFNDMMSQLDGLMNEKYKAGIKIKNLELQALQAQINPHFLYNSLDLINCIAIRNKVPEITTMVNALAKFYKLSLSHGHNIIPLGDELMHVRLYIQIQNLRFENRVHTQWDIDDALLNCRVIKIILQPIIENAIIHGIFERPDKSGILCIRCFACKSAEGKNDVCIEIKDNGVGMDDETIRLNFTPGPLGSIAETKGGYGVRNIQDRLQLAYGAEYGLSCTSTLGAGTTVTIRFPAVFPEESPQIENTQSSS